MAYQKLFEAIVNITGFTPLESDMFEIIDAYKKDLKEMRPKQKHTALDMSLKNLFGFFNWMIVKYDPKVRTRKQLIASYALYLKTINTTKK